MPSEGGIVDGIPVGRVELAGLLLVCWIAAHRVPLRGARFAAVGAVAAMLATAAVPGEGGLHARYYATAAASGAHERSTDFDDPAFTRVDQRLDYVPGERDFPLWFFNDHTRFNFIRVGDPDRRRLEFSVAWTGWWHAGSAGPHTLYLQSPGATAQLAVDSIPVLSSDPASSLGTANLTLSEGWHRVHLTFSSPYGGPRAFSAGEIRGGAQQPFDGSVMRTERIDRRQQLVASALAMAKPAADLLALAWLSALAGVLLLRRIGELWQRRLAAPGAALALAIVAGASEAMRFAWPWAGRFRVMTAGDDPMTYEAYARDILLNGILMNGGLPAGQGEAFYYQAFYPYFLAAAHFIFGENMFGVLFLQRFLVAVTAVVLTRIAMQLRGDAVWPVASIVSGLFVWWKLAPIAADLLNESLYVPLLAGWVAATIGVGLRPTVKRGAIAGVIGGLAALTRSTALLAWLLAWPALFRHLRAGGGRRRVVGVLAACSLAVFSLVAIRNAIVAHEFAPTSTELGVTLRGGNEPPPGLVLDPTPRAALYDRLGIGGYTVEVIEYALAAPGAFAANIARKALFALGFYEPYAPGWGYSPVYIAVWISALAGIAFAARAAGSPWLLTLLPLLVAITQYVAVVVVYPKGERLILPIHVLLVPYAAIAAYEMWLRIAPRSR